MDNRTRMHSVHFYLSDDELRRVDAKCKELGIRHRSNYLRKMVLDGYCVKMDLKLMREMITILRRMSNNLNQYAKMANATGTIYEKDIEDLRERLDEIWELVGKILRETAEHR